MGSYYLYRGYMRDLGQLGESTFSMWCAQVGLVANPSMIDKTGWDFYLQFPISNNLSPQQLHKSAFECKVQVKATDKKDRKLAITISNLRQMATSPMPTFYCFLEFDGQSQVQKAFLLHLNHEIIYSILKRVHEIEQSDKDNNLNKRTMTLHYDEKMEIEKLNGHSLKADLLKYIGDDYSKYIREKSKFLENCGFEEGYGKIQFSVNGEAGIRNIIDVSLGLEEELDVENLTSIEERFGIPSKKSEFKLSNAKLRIGMSTPKKGKVRFKEDHLSSGLMFDIEFYTPPFNFHDFRKYAKFRIVGDFFDIACEPYVGKAHYTFSLGDDQKLKLGKLKDAVSLICLLSRDKQIAIFELDLEGFELLSFTLTSKYIKRELTIFNELLEKASQICEYANVSEEIKVSLKDLYYFRKEIEQFYTLITKSDLLDIKLEIDVEHKFEISKVAHISVLICHLGTHIIGMIFTVIGDFNEILKKNRFSVKNAKIVVERVFSFSPKNLEIIKEAISKEIHNRIQKYDGEYDVFYNWELH